MRDGETYFETDGEKDGWVMVDPQRKKSSTVRLAGDCRSILELTCECLKAVDSVDHDPSPKLEARMGQKNSIFDMKLKAKASGNSI